MENVAKDNEVKFTLVALRDHGKRIDPETGVMELFIS